MVEAHLRPNCMYGLHRKLSLHADHREALKVRLTDGGEALTVVGNEKSKLFRLPEKTGSPNDTAWLLPPPSA